MLIFAAVFGLYGLALLIRGPSLPWEVRFSVKGGDKLEPSPEYILYGRVIGALMIVAAICAVFFHFYVQDRDAARESIKDAWGISIYGDKELRLEADPPVTRVQDVAAVLASLTGQHQSVRVDRSAVVGTDAIGDLGIDFADGDLLVAAAVGTCELEGVTIQESEQSVTVAVMALSEAYIPDTVISCGGARWTGIDADSVLILRVPLEEPLGDRELILAGAAEGPSADPYPWMIPAPSPAVTPAPAEPVQTGEPAPPSEPVQ